MEDIKIGSKDLRAYIYAILRSDSVVLKARGVNLKKAVDLALICKRDWEYTIVDVDLYETEFVAEDNKRRKISNIDIELVRS